MISRWYEHLKTDEERIRFREQILSARPVLERLKDIMKEDFLASHIRNRSPEKFTDNWAFVQAFQNGAEAQTMKFLDLVTLDQKELTVDGKLELIG